MENIQLLNVYLGWTSLVCYIAVIVVTNMKLMRKTAYLSIINDILYGLSMGINGIAKVVINLAVGCINSNRYAKDFTKINKKLIITLTVLATISILGITGFGMYSLYQSPSIAGVLLWTDAALVIGALTVKNIKKYQILMLLACLPAIIGYYMIGETPMVIIKVIVGIIAGYHLVKTFK